MHELKPPVSTSILSVVTLCQLHAQRFLLTCQMKTCEAFYTHVKPITIKKHCNAFIRSKQTTIQRQPLQNPNPF